MLALKIILAIVGIAFVLFGYSIRFKKKYSLINGFDDAFKKREKTEEYAKRVGAVELVVGIVILVILIVLLIFV